MASPITEPRSIALTMEAESKARKKRAAVALERRMKENVMMKTNWCYQLKLASRYLGLQPAKLKGNEGYMREHGAPPQQQHVIFLAIDVSKSTTSLGQGKKKKIIEIGISTLATSDLIHGRARGEEACVVEWFKKIRTRNFKIREWSNFQDTDLVLGCGDNFKKELGTSEWISVHNAPKLIASCFGHASSPSGLDGSSVHNLSTNICGGVVVPKENEEKCNIIVIGHRVEKKISDLRDIIGFDVTKLGNVITQKAIDVLDMFRALQQNPKTRTLHSLLQELDKQIQTKANPGNESHYTIQAMVRICLKSCDAKYRNQMAQERTLRMQDKASQRVEDCRQELAEWDQAEGDFVNDDDDGGEPVPIKQFLNK